MLASKGQLTSSTPMQSPPGAEPAAPNLHEIYSREAANHLAVLQRNCQELESEPSAQVRGEMVRAAHTLASASATLRFAAVNALAALPRLRALCEELKT